MVPAWAARRRAGREREGRVNAKNGRVGRSARAAAAVGALLVAASASAQTDEIMVYTGELAEPGELALAFHNNFVVSGQKAPAFPGGLVPHHSWNGVPELALGVAPWAELGLYLPVYSFTPDDGFQIDGAKLRALFGTPHAEERGAYVGANFELSFNAPHWNPSRWTGEARLIVGGRIGKVELALNPIFDTAFDGLDAVEIVPAGRLGYRVSDRWTVALEEYAALGPVSGLAPVAQQEHTLFAVVDYEGKRLDVELGVGFGLTDSADDVVLKLILSPDL
jgi:hypothetical protein